MSVYVGYGFDANDVKASDLLQMVKAHDPERYALMKEDLGLADEDIDELTEEIKAYLEDVECSVAEYICETVNSGCRKQLNVGDVVVDYDHYVVFECLRFAEDEPRAKLIPNEEGFIKLIGKYLPTRDIAFRNLYEGSAYFAEPNYYMS